MSIADVRCRKLMRPYSKLDNKCSEAASSLRHACTLMPNAGMRRYLCKPAALHEAPKMENKSVVDGQADKMDLRYDDWTLSSSWHWIPSI